MFGNTKPDVCDAHLSAKGSNATKSTNTYFLGEINNIYI